MTTTINNQLLDLANKGIEVTLQNVKSQRIRDIETGWQDWNYELTEQDRQQISQLLGGRHETKKAIFNQLRWLKELPSHWSFDRITFCKHSKRWSYTAGQDYPSELATIRKWFKSI